MQSIKRTIGLGAVFALVFFSFRSVQNLDDPRYLTYTVDLKSEDLQFYWKDDSGKVFRSIQNLKTWLEGKHKTLVFAMNGGMYKPDNSPRGLFIQSQNRMTEMDTLSGPGNFYLKPNGVFYLTENKKAGVCQSSEFKNTEIAFATQSGPMLVIDGKIHPAFKKGSVNLNIRNGVGILPDNKIVFVLSKKEVNFYDFAVYFKSLGCKNALYLDGFVSRAYLPEKKWTQTDGNFGAIIGVSK